MTKRLDCTHKITENELQTLDYVFDGTNTLGNIAQSAGAVEHTDCFSEKGQDPLKRILDMIVNNLMVRLQ